jgi:rfaE bifunctional protein nucleotidyltransferase chain/domain
VGQIISQDNLILRREGWKGNGQCVVFVSGTFDLLHPGHVRLLEQARSHGDVLVVGVQGDEGFRANHEKDHPQKSGVNRSRPITPAAERAEIVASLASVDIVVEYDGASPASLIARLTPDIVVEGGVPLASVPETGVASGAAREGQKTRVVRIVLEPGYSTARIIERIQQVSA